MKKYSRLLIILVLSLIMILALFRFGNLDLSWQTLARVSPIWYGLGYIPTKIYWRLGALFGLLFIGALILVGIPWIKLWI